MAASREQLILEGPIEAALLRLAVPMVVGNLLQTGYQLTDAFWVGRLGTAAVAAVSISFPVMFLVIAAGAGLAMAGATLSAQYMGAGRQDMVNHVAAQTLLMIAFTSVVFGALGFTLAPNLLRLLGVAPDVYSGALSFMRVSFVGIIFIFLYAVFQALMRGIGQVRIPLLIVLGTVVLNFLLDPLLIFGHGPLPPLGVMGAAVSTLVTQGLAAGLCLVIFLRGQHGIHLRWPDFRPDLPYIGRAFRLGLPATVEMSTRAMGPLGLSFLAASFGTQALAAYGVGANILQFISIPAMALSMAVATVVGQNIGAGKLERARRATWLGAASGAGVLTVAGVLAYICAPAFAAFFVPNDAQVIAQAAMFIRVMCLTWGGIGVQLCVLSTFRAAGDMLTAMAIALASQLLFQLPLAWILSKATALSASGLWWSFPITNLVFAAVSAWWFARGNWSGTRLAQTGMSVPPLTNQMQQ